MKKKLGVEGVALGFLFCFVLLCQSGSAMEKESTILSHMPLLTFHNDPLEELDDWHLIDREEEGDGADQVCAIGPDQWLEHVVIDFNNRLKLAYRNHVVRSQREKNTAHANSQYNARIPYLYGDLLKVILSCAPMNSRDVVALYCSSKVFQKAFSYVESLRFDENYCPRDKIYTHRFNRMCPHLKEIIFKGYTFESNKDLLKKIGHLNVKTPFKSLSYFIKDSFNLERITINGCSFEARAFRRFMIDLEEIGMVKELKLINIPSLACMEIIYSLALGRLTDIYVSQSLFTDRRMEVILSKIIPQMAIQMGGIEAAKTSFIDRLVQGISGTFFSDHMETMREGNLQRAIFKNCNINDVSFQFIIHAVLKYTKVILLDFSYNEITKDYKDHILKALPTFAALKIFNLKGNPIEVSQIEKWRKAVPHVNIIF